VAVEEWTQAIDKIGYEADTMRKTLEFFKFEKDSYPPNLPKFLNIYELMRGARFTVSLMERTRPRTPEEKENGIKWMKIIKSKLRTSYEKGS